MNNAEGIGGTYHSTFELSIFVSAIRDCYVSVRNMRTGQTVATSEFVRANTIKQIRVPASTAYITDIQVNTCNTSLLITSTDTVSVYSANYRTATFDAANVLPTSALGSHYIVQMAEPVFFHALLSVTAVEPGYTDVDIYPTKLVQSSNGTFYGPYGTTTPNGTITRDTILTVRLMQGQSIQLGSYTVGAAGDLSGTRVIARNQKKIAVYNGDEITQIISPNGAADHVYEQAFPVNTWGKKFVVTNSMTRCADLVKVTASENNTQVRVNGALVHTLNAYQSYTFWIQSSGPACYIETSQPSAVYLYIASADQCNDEVNGVTIGDPAMVWISPLEQKIQQLNFSTFMPMHQLVSGEYAPDYHCVNIVTPTDAVSSVRLDGVDISSYFTPVPANPQYSYARRNISHASHSIYSSGGVIAHVYGLGTWVSYAYNIGSNILDLTGQIIINGNTVRVTDTTHYCLGDTVFINSAFDGTYDSIYWKLNNGANNRYNPGETLRFIPTRANLGFDSVRMTVHYTYNDTIHTSSIRHIFIVHDTISSTDVQSVCDSYTWHGVTYQTSSASGTKTYNTTNRWGCDSVVYLHLTIHDSTRSDSSGVYCDRYAWHGNTYQTSSASGTKNFRTTNRYGCDSVAYLHLTIHDSTRSDSTGGYCDRYTWHGVSYLTSSASGTKTYNTTNRWGCDSVAYLHLTIRDSTRSDSSGVYCDNYTWHGITYRMAAASGTKTYSATNRWGCDSVAYLHLVIHDTSESHIYDTIVENQLPWAYQHTLFHGDTSDVHFTFVNAQGCDSVLHYNLYYWRNIVRKYDSIACNNQLPFDWMGRSFLGSDSIATLHTAQHGEDSTIIQVLEVRDTSSIDVYDTIVQNWLPWYYSNTQFQSDVTDYRFHRLNSVGCDSTVHYNLYVYRNVRSAVARTICDNEFPYEWNGVTFTTTGAQSATFLTTHGADSLVLMTLRSKPTYEDSIFAETCNGRPYSYAGESYWVSGMFPVTFTAANGCDSVIKLHLEVHPTYMQSVTSIICDDSSYVHDGHVYTKPSTYQLVYPTVYGCDSTISIRLLVRPTYSNHVELIFCQGTSVDYHDTTYTSAGIHLFEMTSMDGCDSLEYLYLFEEELPIADITLDPEYASYEHRDIRIRDNSKRALSREWYIDGSYAGEEPVVYYEYPMERDSIPVCLIVTGNLGCKDSTMDTIPFRKNIIWTPNVITPKLSTNSRFWVAGDKLATAEVSIYTRRGAWICTFDGMTECWNGTKDGKYCQQDSYMYIVRYTTNTAPNSPQVKTGTVTLLY